MALPAPTRSALGAFIQSPLRVRDSEIIPGVLDYEAYGDQRFGQNSRFEPGPIDNPYDGIWTVISPNAGIAGVPRDPPSAPIVWHNGRLWIGNRYWNGFAFILPPGSSVPDSTVDNFNGMRVFEDQLYGVYAAGPFIEVYNYLDERWEQAGGISSDINFPSALWDDGVSLYVLCPAGAPVNPGNPRVFVYVARFNPGTGIWEPAIFTSQAAMESWGDTQFGEEPLNGGVTRYAEVSGVLYGGGGLIEGEFSSGGYTYTYWDGVVSSFPNLRTITNEQEPSEQFPKYNAAPDSTVNSYFNAAAAAGTVYTPGVNRSDDDTVWNMVVNEIQSSVVNQTLLFTGTESTIQPEWSQSDSCSSVGEIDENRIFIFGRYFEFSDSGSTHNTNVYTEYNVISKEAKQIGRTLYEARIGSVDATNPASNTFRVTINTSFVEVPGNASKEQTQIDLMDALIASTEPFISDYTWPDIQNSSRLFGYKPVGYAYDPVLSVSGSGSGSIEPNGSDFILNSFPGINANSLAVFYPPGMERPTLQSPPDQVVSAFDPYSQQISSTASPDTWLIFDAPPTMSIDQVGLLTDATPAKGTWQIAVYASNARTYANGASYELIVQDTPPDISNPGPQSSPDATEWSVQIDLLSGDQPITWSLVSAPPGVDIFPFSTFAFIIWAATTSVGSPFTITVRADNAVDFDEETFTLTVA
ncbi:MAG: hypothetical protein WBO58_10010 [Gammaproteobacteria bacterium]